MKTMTPRERVLCTLRHKEPDRVPIDLGSTLTTSMVKESLDGYRKYLGLEGEHELAHKQLGLAMPQEDMLQLLEVDTRRIALNPPGNFREILFEDGSYQDEWGVIRRKAGFYYDNVHQPLGTAETLGDLKKFKWPDPDDRGRFAGLREKAEKLYNETEYALVSDLAIDGLLDISREVVGLDKFMVDLHVNPGFAEAWLDMMTEYSIRILTNFMKAVGKYIQVVCVTDDLGFQDRVALSPEIYRKFLKPRHKKIYEAIKENTNAILFQHCCGSVYEIIPDLIEEGIEILNPIQTRAANMSAEKLSAFKKELSFWGGIDEQAILPNGTPQQVSDEVKRIIEILGVDGGFIPYATHNIQPDIPVENIAAMFEAIKKYGSYGKVPPSRR